VQHAEDDVALQELGLRLRTRRRIGRRYRHADRPRADSPRPPAGVRVGRRRTCRTSCSDRSRRGPCRGAPQGGRACTHGRLSLARHA
jgi:hypothetical protein